MAAFLPATVMWSEQLVTENNTTVIGITIQNIKKGKKTQPHWFMKKRGKNVHTQLYKKIWDKSWVEPLLRCTGLKCGLKGNEEIGLWQHTVRCWQIICHEIMLWETAFCMQPSSWKRSRNSCIGFKKKAWKLADTTGMLCCFKDESSHWTTEEGFCMIKH